jgi:hypothetical protein
MTGVIYVYLNAYTSDSVLYSSSNDDAIIYSVENGSTIYLHIGDEGISFKLWQNVNIIMLNSVRVKCDDDIGLLNDKSMFEIKEQIDKELDDVAAVDRQTLQSQLKEKILVSDNVEFWPDSTNVDSQRGWINKEKLIIHYFDIVWNETLSFYFTSLEKSVSEEILGFLKGVGWQQIRNHDLLNEVLKEMGEYAKYMGVRLSKNWRFYVDLQMCYRYYSKYYWGDLLKDIHEWFHPKPLMWDSRQQWLNAFEEGLRSWFTNYWVKPERVKYDTFIEYLTSCDWGTNGATDMHVPMAKIKGDLEKVEKNKNASMLVADMEAIFKRLFKTPGQVNKVTVKPDEAPNKTRVIVSSDTLTYLLQSYIGQWFTAGYSNEISTAYKDSEQAVNFWLGMSTMCLNHDDVKIPLDQKGFDHHVDRDMLKLFYKVMYEYALTTNNIELINMVTLLRENIFSKSIWSTKIPDKDVDANIIDYCFKNNITIKSYKGISTLTGEWIGGIPSGWKWTIDTDTIVNYAELYAILKLSGKDVASGIKYNIFQGDDLAPIVSSLSVAKSILYGYRYCGLEINVRKFFIANDRHEFLRRVVTDTGVYGYPARTVHSLLWRSPGAISREQVSPWSMADLWLIYARRGAFLPFVYVNMIDDICGAFDMVEADVVDWLVTPASVGGYGASSIFGLRDKWVKVETKPDSQEWDINEKPKGLDDIKKVFELTKLEVNKIVKSLVTVKGTKKVSYYTQNVDMSGIRPLNPYRWDAPIKVYWRKGIPNVLKGILIDRIMESRLYADLYLQASTNMTLQSLYANTSKAVLRDWLMGDIQGKIPKLQSVGNDYVSGFFKRDTYAIQRVLFSRKCNRKTVVNASLWVELNIQYGYKLKQSLNFMGLGENFVLAQ